MGLQVPRSQSKDSSEFLTNRSICSRGVSLNAPIYSSATQAGCPAAANTNGIVTCRYDLRLQSRLVQSTSSRTGKNLVRWLLGPLQFRRKALLLGQALLRAELFASTKGRPIVGTNLRSGPLLDRVLGIPGRSTGAALNKQNTKSLGND